MRKNRKFKKNLCRLADDSDLHLTAAQLREIIEEELEKDENEMDTELIEACMDAYNGLCTNAEKQKKVRSLRSYKKTLTIAAVLAAVLMVLIGTASANDMHLPLFENGFARYDNGASMPLTDGWFLYVEMNRFYNENGALTDVDFIVDGVNLEWQEIGEDFNVELWGKDGALLQSVAPQVHALCMNDAYSAQLQPLEEFFEARTPTPDLTAADLDFLDCTGLMFTEEQIVQLYNEAVGKPAVEMDIVNSPYVTLPQNGIYKNESNAYTWQVGYLALCGVGGVGEVHITLIDENDRHLSSFSSEPQTNAEREIIEQIIAIETAIERENNMLPDEIDFNIQLHGIDFSVLQSVLQEIEHDNEESLFLNLVGDGE